MSEQAQNVFISIGALCILFGMFRLIYINHRSPHNVNLVSWMFTGGLIEFVMGMFKGTANILRLYIDPNAFAAFFVYLGILIIALVL